MIHRFSQSDSSVVPSQGLDRRTDMEQAHPLIQQHDDQSVDHGLAKSLASELINISGAEVTVYIRTRGEGYDEVYDEEADPVYKSGKRLKAFFAPKPIEAQLTPWGLDAENKATIIFDRNQVISEFGSRMIMMDDVIEIPYNAAGIKPDRYRVLNASDSGNFRYQWLYWSCQIENLTNDITVEPDSK